MQSHMLTPPEALARILEHVSAPEAVENVPLAAAAGRCLARAARSDVDLPPFEKAMMDGFAVRAADFATRDGDVSLDCVGESRAGVPFAGAVPAGSCIEIYTGAQLPVDCDAVVKVEDTSRDSDRVTFHKPAAKDDHVAHRAEILAAGCTALEACRRLTASDLAVLAAVGVDPVPCFPRPRVTILTTGDELVPATEIPGPGQIREGNTRVLAAACAAFGCDVLHAGIVPDDPDRLATAFREALDRGDALVTTGGVSVGKYDLVGEALERVGVERVLHKVAVKPGKPIWFGMAGSKPVFGLPGNPVSTLFGLETFVRPALARLAGAGDEEQAERLETGRWQGKALAARGRQVNVPARRCSAADGVVDLLPLPYRGSADIVSVTEAETFVVIEPKTEIQPGQLVPHRPLVTRRLP